MGGIAWNRYPDRGATALRARIAEVEGSAVPGGIGAENVFVANGSNEVLQTICLAYGGAGRHRADPRADLRAALPHRPGLRHRGGRGRAARRLHAGRRRRGRPRRLGASGDHVPVLAQQPDRSARGRGDGASGARSGGVGRRPAGGRRGLRAVLPVVGALAGRRGPLHRGQPHLLQDVVGCSAPARVPGRSDLVRRASSTRSCCRTTWTPSSSSPGSSRWTTWTRCGRGSRVWSSSAVGSQRRSTSWRWTSGRPPRTSSCSAPGTAPARRSGPSSSSDRCWCATARPGPGWLDCLRVTLGTPEENDEFLAALAEVLASPGATHPFRTRPRDAVGVWTA